MATALNTKPPPRIASIFVGALENNQAVVKAPVSMTRNSPKANTKNTAAPALDSPIILF